MQDLMIREKINSSNFEYYSAFGNATLNTSGGRFLVNEASNLSASDLNKIFQKAARNNHDVLVEFVPDARHYIAEITATFVHP